MPYTQLEDIEEKEIVPGYHARFVHTDTMTIAYWRIEAGASLPEHSHVHEQVASVIEGEFEMTLEGETSVLHPGKIAMIPSNAPHSGKAITDCRIIDVFHPVREDYR